MTLTYQNISKAEAVARAKQHVAEEDAKAQSKANSHLERAGNWPQSVQEQMSLLLKLFD